MQDDAQSLSYIDGSDAVSVCDPDFIDSDEDLLEAEWTQFAWRTRQEDAEILHTPAYAAE